MRFKFALFAASMLSAPLLLTGCATSAPSREPADMPLPPAPPPPGPEALAPMTDAVKALYGEWRPVSGRGVLPKDRLTIWSPMFSFGSGCNFSRGMLRDEDDGRFTVEEGFGGTLTACETVEPLVPFTSGIVSIEIADGNSMRVERGGETWLFRKVDVTATVPRDDFVRGEWLLADRRGRPYRDEELTRVAFDGRGYRVDAPNCSFWSNGWFNDRDGQIRAGGNQYTQSVDCRPRTLGDRLAEESDNVRLIAEPVETRITVVIGNQRATLVPAARYPELATDAEAIAPHPWAVELAEKASAIPVEQRAGLALRAIGFGGEGLPGVERPADPRALAFVGMTAWHYAHAQQAGLVHVSDTDARSLAEHFAIASIVVRAVLEGIRPVDRGDGLSLDYLYRVREGWRGGKQTGDLMIVRMPPLEGKSRSPVITPDPGEEVLLLASRTGYLAGRLVEGEPPSFDTRVVQMTLPLMRIVDGRLAEAVEGANVLGAASFAGMTVEDARAQALRVDQKMAAFGQWQPFDLGRQPDVRRYFITRIGDRELTDPTRLWITYDSSTNFGNPNGYGGVVAYFDGCSPVRMRRSETGWTVYATTTACPDSLPDGSPVAEPAIARLAQWIDANTFPYGICIRGCPTDVAYTVPLPEGDVILRDILR